MNPKHQFVRSALAMAICALGAFHGAQAEAIGNASVNIENLRFRLVDLTPDDGIAPSISFNGAVWDGSIKNSGPTRSDISGVVSQGSPEFVDAALNGVPALSPTAPSSTTTAGGSVIFQNGGQLTLSSKLNSESLSNTTALSSETSTYGGPTPYTDPVTGDHGVLNTAARNGGIISEGESTASTYLKGTNNPLVPYDPYARITLGANTQLIIEGSVSSSLYADPSNLLQLQGTLPVNQMPDVSQPGVSLSANGSFLRTGGYALVEAVLNDDDAALNIAYASIYNSVTYDETGIYETVDYGDLTQVATSTYALARSENLLLQATNTGSTAKNLTLMLSAMTGFQQLLIVPTTQYETQFTPDSAIPEPGTYALMGLGLAGIAFARRRTRR